MTNKALCSKSTPTTKRFVSVLFYDKEKELRLWLVETTKAWLYHVVWLSRLASLRSDHKHKYQLTKGWSCKTRQAEKTLNTRCWPSASWTLATKSDVPTGHRLTRGGHHRAVGVGTARQCLISGIQWPFALVTACARWRQAWAIGNVGTRFAFPTCSDQYCQWT
jgi:hypothetical protein